ncbi:MAG TPA: helix-turn-helix domain-containing protein, partial [Terriglobia bacterium]|nr:helix-turn-helix domain-containing protein [Terriglobia bacterium]
SDIPALVHDFLARHAGDGTPTTVISSDAMACLKNYNWPGNVRELENSVQRALALGTGPLIQMNDLPSSVLCPVLAQSAAGEVSSLKDMERQAIIHALQDASGDRRKAAKKLGIGRTTIYRKLKELGLEN